MSSRILYAGDGTLPGGANYLAGVLGHFGLPFDYIESQTPIGPTLRKHHYSLVILSDYPRKNFTDSDFDLLLGAVQSGDGLLMIGGWDSFQGLGGHYAGSPLETALPVLLEKQDDRVNSAQPLALLKKSDHPIVAGLPMDRPPCVGGYNRLRAKPSAQTVLVARPLEVRTTQSDVPVELGAETPLLVTGAFGAGRTAAFASDVSPHWVGTLVDWGEKRITAPVPGGHVEIGHLYAEFLHRIVRWTMGQL